MNPLAVLDGYKTIIAGIGLIGLGIYECTEGQFEKGLQSMAEGLAALGIRRAIQKQSEAPVIVVTPPVASSLEVLP